MRQESDGVLTSYRNRPGKKKSTKYQTAMKSISCPAILQTISGDRHKAILIITGTSMIHYE